MDQLAAQNLLVSDPVISHRLLDLSGLYTQKTDLRRAVFFRPDKSRTKIVPHRQSISAILLVAISGAQSDIVGILHPEPAVVFDPSLFPRVPYIRVRNWPIVDGRIEVEWLTQSAEQGRFYHTKIR
jgi:hypothetical protein